MTYLFFGGELMTSFYRNTISIISNLVNLQLKPKTLLAFIFTILISLSIPLNILLPLKASTELSSNLAAQTYVQNNLVTNGIVNDIEVADGIIYLAGHFTQVGPDTGSAVPFDINTGRIATSFPKVNNTIRAIIPDGSGGWFIGGDFTLVGGLTRNRIAHILSDGTVDPNWNPNIDPIGNFMGKYGNNFEYISNVTALALSGSTLYVGGGFSTVGDKARSSIAAIDTKTGNVTDWNPNVYDPHIGVVKALAVKDSTLYVGGQFTEVGGQIRYNLASVDISTGNVTTWNPNVNYDGRIYTFVVSNSILYVGGDFKIIGGQIRNGLAAIDTTTGNVTTWNPNVRAIGLGLAINGSTIYAGDGNSIVAIDTTTGKVTSLNLEFTGSTRGWNIVNAIAIHDSTLYVGGDFTMVNNEVRNNLASINLSTKELTSWNPNLGAYVLALAFSDPTLYVGGEFTTIGGQTRNNLAAIDATTGNLTSFNPDIGRYAIIHAIEVNGSTLYVGGGRWGNNLAAIDTNTGRITSWNPGVNGEIYDLKVKDSTLYVGGNFSSIGGQSRNDIAAIDLVTRDVTNWKQDVEGGIYVLLIDDSTLYAGGDFISIGGQQRNNLAAIDLKTGAVKDWNPNILSWSRYVGNWGKPKGPGWYQGWSPHFYGRGRVSALAVSSSNLYIGGIFTANGQRDCLIAVDKLTGSLSNWSPRIDGGVFALTVKGSTLYIGGGFEMIDGKNRINLASINLTTGNVTDWAPNAGPLCWNPDEALGQCTNSIVATLTTDPSTLYAGGNFTSVGNDVNSFFARFSLDQGTSLPSSNTSHLPSGKDTNQGPAEVAPNGTHGNQSSTTIQPVSNSNNTPQGNAYGTVNNDPGRPAGGRPPEATTTQTNSTTPITAPAASEPINSTQGNAPEPNHGVGNGNGNGNGKH